MIQFNLLPDVKLEYIRAKRLKAIMTTVSIFVSSAALVTALFLLFFVSFIQKNSIQDLEADIDTAAKKVQNTPNLNRILTVQNQLGSLSTVHSTKPAATRFFDYIARVTPADITISNAKIDYVNNKLEISGEAPGLLSINRYVDTMKFTNFVELDEKGNSAKDDPGKPAFTQVLLDSFSPDKSSTTFNVSVIFVPEIFDNQKLVALSVPEGISTRSQQKFLQKQPTILFKEDPRINQEDGDE